jgi:hypothetical protein
VKDGQEMNVNLHTCIGQAGLRGRRGRQRGGETVEFALLAFFFFVLLFTVIDMSLVMFNNAATNHAARYAARQGTLYWMLSDNDFDESDPRGNICVKDEMIESVVEFYEDNILIPTAEGFSPPEFDVVGAVRDDGNNRWCEVRDNNVQVSLAYPHDYVILDGLLSLAGINLQSDIGLNTESHL